MHRLESPDKLDMWHQMAEMSANRLARFRNLNAPDILIQNEARILYRRRRIVAKLMLRNVARCN